jgi:hypothetical protein
MARTTSTAVVARHVARSKGRESGDPTNQEKSRLPDSKIAMYFSFFASNQVIESVAILILEP